jgi:hypothetical protein
MTMPETPAALWLRHVLDDEIEPLYQELRTERGRWFRLASCRLSAEEHFRLSCYPSHCTRSPASCFFIKRPRLRGPQCPAQLHRRANSFARRPILNI